MSIFGIFKYKEEKGISLLSIITSIIIFFFIVALIMLFVFMAKNANNTSIDDQSQDEDFVSTKTFKADLDGDLETEDIKIIIYEGDHFISDDALESYCSYKIFINEELKYKSKYIRDSSISNNDIIVKDYDEDGINEIIINAHNHGISVSNRYDSNISQYIHKKIDNEIKLIDVRGGYNDNLIKKCEDLVKNGKNDYDDRVLFNVGDISLLGIKDSNRMKLYLYNLKDKSLITIYSGESTTEYINYDVNKNNTLINANSFYDYVINRWIAIQLNSIVEQIDYKFEKNNEWNDIKITQDYTYSIDKILIHSDNKNKVCHLIIKYNNQENYYYVWIPYYIGSHILKNVD